MENTVAREKWNRRYAQPAFEPFPDAPSEWLVEHRDLLLAAGASPAGGRALDVACGDGRNSAYLAGLGFAVDAVDLSDVAVDALRAAARSRGLRVSAQVADLETQPLPEGGYDAIVNLNYLQRDLFPWLSGALAPRGLLVFETFTEDHVAELGNRFDPRFLLAPNELLYAFPKLLVRHYQEGVAERSGQRRAVASLVAQRPAAG